MTDEQQPRDSEFVAWLKEAMAARGIKSIRQLGNSAGVSHSTLASILRGEYPPRQETITRLAAHFRVSPDFLIDKLPGKRHTARIPTSTLLEQATGVIMVPVLEQRAGAGAGVDIVDYIYLPPKMGGKDNIVAIGVHGSCMAPRIEDGDRVVVEMGVDWENGEVVLARVGDELLVKRAYANGQGGMVRLHPDAEGYQDVYVPATEVLGPVRQIIKRP
jgi:SOS-response transcriptional repressor LexA